MRNLNLLGSKIPAITALCALVLLRMVDLAVFDAAHDHVETPHVEKFAAAMVHDHDIDELDEPNEHASVDDTAMHVSFHTLLSVYISAPTAATVTTSTGSTKYRRNLGQRITDTHSRPPVPPPLA